MNQVENVAQVLHQVARNHTIGIALAVRCGPGAWKVPGGEAVQVTALFTRPPQAYLGLAEPADVVRHDGPPPVLAWDARRALRLALRSNATVWAWLGSPDVVVGQGEPLDALRDLLRRTLSRQALLGHALGEAKTAMNTYLPDGPAVAARAKYGLLLRPLMAVSWLLQRNEPPPADWPSLRAGLEWEAGVAAALDALEAGALEQRRVAALDAWIDGVFQAARDRGDTLSDTHPPLAEVEALYRALIAPVFVTSSA